MNDLIRQLREQRVLVVGDAILDEYLSGDCARLSPEAPVPVLQVRDVREVLGGAANTAANITALGGQAVLITVVGRDAAGDTLLQRAAQASIDLRAVHDDRPTPRKTRVLAPRQQLVRLDYEQTRPIGTAAAAEVMALVEEQLPNADIVIVSDYAKGLLTRDLCQRIIRTAHERGIDVVIDPRPAHRDFYALGDYLTPNWQEAQALLGRSGGEPTEEAIRETGHALVQAFHANIVLTLGAHGIAFFSRERSDDFVMPTTAREVFDVSGAGDTVVAVFAVARAAGAGHADAVALANRAAGVVVGKFGTATLTPDELLDAADAAGRLVTRHELAGLCATLRARGKRVVTVNGAFDLIHAGHLHILQDAGRQGDVVIVGLNSDASVRLRKGPGRPVVPQAQRAALLLALRVVDYVHIFDELTPTAFLEQVRPDVHVNGAEYGADCIEAPVVARYGGRVHLTPRIPGLSTTAILETRKALETGAPPAPASPVI